MNNKLSKLRDTKHISQKELAVEMGVSQQTISSWETDRSLPKPYQMTHLENFFGTPKEDIFFGSFNFIM
jgi:putative transcriptional regulator